MGKRNSARARYGISWRAFIWENKRRNAAISVLLKGQARFMKKMVAWLFLLVYNKRSSIFRSDILGQLKNEIYKIVDELPEELMGNLHELILWFLEESSEETKGEDSGSIDMVLAKAGVRISELSAMLLK